MEFVNEMDEVKVALSKGLEAFKNFIRGRLSTNKNYLEQFFWTPPNGLQMTVLNFLIQEHQESKSASQKGKPVNDLTTMIDYVFDLSNDKNVGEPIHQAVSLGKTKLALHLFGATILGSLLDNVKTNITNVLNTIRKKAKEITGIKDNDIDVDKRDRERRTLISLVLATKNTELLVNLLARQPNIHAATPLINDVQFQPIHQAVALEYIDGIRLLAHQGAQLGNPVGVMKDTPALLAARLGKINALEALLEFPAKMIALDAENNHFFEDKKTGHTAIEELCERIANNEGKEEALRGVAMILCHGGEPPRMEGMRHLLSSNRISLLKAIHQYLEDKPVLVDSFVERCHLRESALHNIVYADHSWGSSIRHLFGRPSEAAFIIENLVVRKYTNPSLIQANVPPLTTTAAANLSGEKDPLKLYAEFVRRYNQAYDSQKITNAWSTMRWMIAEGRCDWDTVVRYQKNHPTSRTRIIYNEMFSESPKVHEDIEGQTDKRSMHPAR